MNISRRGFTIVELIIVIVVIGIITTIAAVSYRGVRERAYNAQIVTGAKEYLGMIKAYQAGNGGAFPPTSREVAGNDVAMTCLGVGYPNKTCGIVSGVATYEDDLFNEKLSGFIKTPLPPISEQMLSVESEAFIGAVYGLDFVGLSSTGYGRTLQYALFGSNADCQLSGAYSYNISSVPATTACEILLEERTPG